MSSRARQIVTFRGGGFSMEAGNPLLDSYVPQVADAERPEVCFLPSASGDVWRAHRLDENLREAGRRACCSTG